MVKKKILKELASAPAIALEEVIEEAGVIKKSLFSKKPFRRAEEYWRTLGPGLTTGAADDDPSGIATYSQTGARYGFSLLWLAAFTFPLMAVIQEMCARIGLVTGKGLAANIRSHFPAWVLYTATILLLMANIFNIGADLGAMAKATQLIWPWLNFSLLVISFAVISLALQIFTTYARYARWLKWLSLILLTYVLSAFFSNINWGEVAGAALVPHLDFSANQFLLICAILGTTISPYLFFWQSSQEVEQEIMQGEKTVAERKKFATPQTIKSMRIDIWTGMFFSNAVMFFIIAACSATLYANGIFDIQTADQAAVALKPFAGEFAYLLFAIGIIGIGFLAIPVLAGSASYAIAEAFGWQTGLYRKLKDAYAFYGVIIIAMLVGILLNFIGLDPIKALIYSAVANGLVAPVVLVLIVKLASNKKLMKQFVNGRKTNIVGWVATGLMVVAGVAAVVSLFF